MSPLRIVVTGMALALTCVGLSLIICGFHVPGWQMLVLGMVLLVGTVFERWRYRRIEQQPLTADWQQTGERFVDPASGKPVDVLFNSRTGERRYVPATPGAPQA